MQATTSNWNAIPSDVFGEILRYLEDWLELIHYVCKRWERLIAAKYGTVKPRFIRQAFQGNLWSRSLVNWVGVHYCPDPDWNPYFPWGSILPEERPAWALESIPKDEFPSQRPIVLEYALESGDLEALSKLHEVAPIDWYSHQPGVYPRINQVLRSIHVVKILEWIHQRGGLDPKFNHQEVEIVWNRRYWFWKGLAYLRFIGVVPTLAKPTIPGAYVGLSRNYSRRWRKRGFYV
jgi:hypothetical protein